MKTHFFSYRTQIFIASLLLLIIPSTILGITAANQTASTVKEDFSQTMETILTQTDLTLNTLLNDATKLLFGHPKNNPIFLPIHKTAVCLLNSLYKPTA